MAVGTRSRRWIVRPLGGVAGRRRCHRLDAIGRGRGEVLVVFANFERLAVGRGGASAPNRTAHTSRPEAGCAGATDRDGDTVGAGDRASDVVDRELVAVQ